MLPSQAMFLWFWTRSPGIASVPDLIANFYEKSIKNASCNSLHGKFCRKPVSCSCQYKHFCHLPSLNHECGRRGKMLKESGAATWPGTGSTWLCVPFCATFGDLYPCVHQRQDTAGICSCLSLILQLCPLLLGVMKIQRNPVSPGFI